MSAREESNLSQTTGSKRNLTGLLLYEKCLIKVQCIGRSYEKKNAITVYAEEYERNNELVRSRYGRQMKAKRQSTVEPVWGTLTQFIGLRKINTIGIEQANKVFQMAACAYNLKKLLKFIKNDTQTKAQSVQAFVYRYILSFRKPLMLT